MATMGVVRVWHSADGWGVIDSDQTPGGCWAHFSHVLVSGYATLQAGQSVMFEHETADQDGYSFRAVEVWPADQEPDRSRQATAHEPSRAYRSRLTITWKKNE